MESGHPTFINAYGTIRFIRVIDKHFDLLNSKNLFFPSYKQPLKLIERLYGLTQLKKEILG